MNTKLKNTIFSILLTAMIISLNSVYAAGLDITDKSELKALIQTHHSRLQSFEVTYAVEEYYHPFTGEEAEKSRQKLLLYSKTLDRMKKGQLTNYEKNRFKHLKIQDFEELVEQQEKFLHGYTVESFQVFRQNGNKMRVDYFFDNQKPNHQFDVFNGRRGYHVTADTQMVRSGPSYDEKWVTPLGCIHYGGGIDQWLKRGATITEFKQNQQKIKLDTPAFDERYDFELTLLDDNKAYWKQCDLLVNGKVQLRIICSEFKDYNGFLIPQQVEYFRSIDGELVPDKKMTLVDAKINVNIPHHLFNKPNNNNFEFESLRR